MSFRWKQAEVPVRAADRGDPVSQRFSDQLIAVLPRLRRFARGLTGTASEADDLVQAACERALAREHQFQEGTRFDSWMFRIVQTLWIDQLRAREVRKEDGDVAEERLGSDSAVRTIEARLALAEVRRAVQLLPGSAVIKIDFARALLETNNTDNDREAVRNLELARQQESDSFDLWRLMASGYSRLNNPGMTSLARAEMAVLRGQRAEAQAHADAAVRQLQSGTPAWQRAQDIKAYINTRPGKGR